MGQVRVRAAGRSRRPGRWRTVVHSVVLLALILSSAVVPPRLAFSAPAEQGLTATLTVLRGTAAVLKSDGTPVSPAASGLAVSLGDQIATLARSSALLTFFEGSEVELGADTTIIVRDLQRSGSQTTITLESVIGATVHRVTSLADPGSSYRVETGGSVALVRGTVFGHFVDGNGNVTVGVSDGDVEFPRAGSHVRRGERVTATSRGDVISDKIDPNGSLFNSVTAPVSGQALGTDNPGMGTGSNTVPQQSSQQQQPDDPEIKPQSSTGPVIIPGQTQLVAVTPAGSRVLVVASSAGFNIGDIILIGSGPTAEYARIVGVALGEPTVPSDVFLRISGSDPLDLNAADGSTTVTVECAVVNTHGTNETIVKVDSGPTPECNTQPPNTNPPDTNPPNNPPNDTPPPVTTNTWISTASGSWHTASNWSLGRVPDANDNVVIDQGAITVTYSTGASTVRSLRLGSTLSITGGSLTLNQASTVLAGAASARTPGGSAVSASSEASGGRLTLSGGTLAGAGALTIEGELFWSGGTILGPGTTTITSSACLLISGSGSKTLDARALLNHGETIWQGSGTLAVENGATVSNESDGYIQARGQQTLTHSVGSIPRITNRGVFERLNGGDSESETDVGQVTFEQRGRLRVLEGTMRFRNGITQFSGFTRIGEGATLRTDIPYLLNGGRLRGEDDATLDGSLNNVGGMVRIGLRGGGENIGTFAITDSYTQGSTAALRVKVRYVYGSGPGPHYCDSSDRLEVGNVASLNGKLEIVMDCNLPYSSEWTLLDATTLTGTFSEVTGLLHSNETIVYDTGDGDVVLRRGS